MALHAQRKGKRGENEFCKWLDKNLYNEKESNRNYNQADGHSSDVITDDFVFEVKRREGIDLQSWWHQVVVAKKRLPGDLIPVVAFRQNRKPWEFLVPASVIGVKLGYIRLTEAVFLEWARCIVNYNDELTSEEQTQFDGLSCEDKKTIYSRHHTLGYSRAYLSDKYNVSFKVITKVIGERR